MESFAVVGAPISFSTSRIRCQSSPYRYVIIIVPTPHCSPCNAGLSATIFRAWLNLCSDPEAGAEEPAILIATPLDTSAVITVHAVLLFPLRISLKFASIISAVISERAAA